MINHPVLEPFKCAGGLFDVEPCEMDLRIGQRGRFLNPTCVIEREPFEVIGVQKNWAGKKCWRVAHESDADRFGKILNPDTKVEWFE